MNKKTRNKHNRKAHLYQLQGGRCAYCNKHIPMRAATLDHVVPRSMGGPNTRDNQVVACLRCNGTKSNGSAHVLVGMLMQGLVA